MCAWGLPDSLLRLLPLQVLLPLIGPSIIHEGLEKLVLLAFQELSPLSLELPQCFDSSTLFFVLVAQPLIFLCQVRALLSPVVDFLDFFNLRRYLMDLLICFRNFRLFPSQLAREAVFFRQARYGFDFQIFGAREDRKAREEVISVADEHTTTWSTYTPCNRRSITLAEEFMVRIQSSDCNYHSICVGLVVGVNAE